MLKFIFAACILLFSQPTTVSAIPKEDEALCNAVIARLLSPQIQAEINRYYGKILVHPPTYAPFYGTQVRCEAASTNKTSYSVTIIVIPYVGAHVSVGVDEIKFLVGLNGDVKTISYKHVEDHKLPSHLQYMYR
ncbi:hypothetical protein QFZ77_003013 [Paenibacillus sp. V4I3]|uniref:DUF3888 domain-containing protein n=1 Tax=Paenibacillus sp. V4I3 TaxID=3042305 RepID=UPI00278B47D0|nr:DUF3888 domain-containing protein [Paenibacillus sp. V4I3]MDQ0874354.1 hypothetical protein [Paenibacillus sp. V4I3]